MLAEQASEGNMLRRQITVLEAHLLDITKERKHVLRMLEMPPDPRRPDEHESLQAKVDRLASHENEVRRNLKVIERVNSS